MTGLLAFEAENMKNCLRESLLNLNLFSSPDLVYLISLILYGSETSQMTGSLAVLITLNSVTLPAETDSESKNSVGFPL